MRRRTRAVLLKHDDALPTMHPLKHDDATPLHITVLGWSPAQRAGRAEAECAAERSGRAQVERLLDGDPDGLQALPLDVLEQWQGRLRLALEAATDALVEMRVAVARRAEAEAAEAAIREKEAAGVPLATDCPICMERHMDTAMDCGHRACGACAEQLRVCHTCRKPVTLRLRLF